MLLCVFVGFVGCCLFVGVATVVDFGSVTVVVDVVLLIVDCSCWWWRC